MAQYENEKNSATHEKSVLYPRYTWNEALSFVKEIDSFHMKSVSYSALAQQLGIANISTKSFAGKISTCRQFGLIATTGQTLSLTEAAKKILYPIDVNDLSTHYLCFSLPPLYKKLIDNFDGHGLPPLASLANMLYTSYGIASAVKESAAKQFIESATQLGILQAGVLRYSELLNKEQVQTINEEVQGAEKEETTPPLKESVVSHQIQIDEANYYTQSIPVQSGKIAKFIIPVDCTEDDILLIRDMFDVLLKRRFKVNTNNE